MFCKLGLRWRPRYLIPLCIHLKLSALTEEEKHVPDMGIASDLCQLILYPENLEYDSITLRGTDRVCEVFN